MSDLQSSYITQNPVVFLTYIRPKIASEVFARIRENKPKILYIFSDGPRNSNEEKLVQSTRQTLLEMIDWECDLTTKFLDVNKGVYNMWRYLCDEVFAREETMIFLQEDLLPSNSFFRYCDEMLDYYKNNPMVYMISGMNYLGDYTEMAGYSYFFKERNTTLGIALWKRTYLNFLSSDSQFFKSSYYMNLSSAILKKNRKVHWIKKMNQLKELNLNQALIGEEFDLMGLNPNILYNQLVIVPRVNLIKHIGFDKSSEHMPDIKTLPKRMRMLDDMKLYEMDFPLVHHDYYIVDENYTKILSNKFPRINFIHQIIINFERALRILVYQGPLALTKKIISIINRG